MTGHEHAIGNHFGNVAGVDSVSVVFLTWLLWQESNLPPPGPCYGGLRVVEDDQRD